MFLLSVMLIASGVGWIVLRDGQVALHSYPKPPSSANDACTIFAEHPEWYNTLLQAERRYQAPLPIMLAIIWKESRFVANARPPRKRVFFGLLRGKPMSTAYGYAQAIDGTWEWYLREQGRRFAQRTNFADAVDFVGWYMRRSDKTAGVKTSDPVGHYLAYHQGHQGYKSGRWRQSGAIQAVAREVALMSRIYEKQLQSCVEGFSARQTPRNPPLPLRRPNQS